MAKFGKSNLSSIFLDTWGWLALGNSNDPYHEIVKNLYLEIHQSSTVIYTSDYVLDELISLLFRRERFDKASTFVNSIFEADSNGIIKIESITIERFRSAWDLRIKYQDKPLISFTDLTSMVLMTELGITNILTQDEHFIQVGLGFLRIPFDIQV